MYILQVQMLDDLYLQRNRKVITENRSRQSAKTQA